MAGVHDDRQVREGFQRRDSREVQRVAVLGLEGADAALAEHHVLVAARHDVFGGEQPLLDGRREAALEEHRLVVGADLLQELEVLHVTGADLDDVGLLEEVLDVARVQDLADDRQACLPLGLGQVIQPLVA